MLQLHGGIGGQQPWNGMLLGFREQLGLAGSVPCRSLLCMSCCLDEGSQTTITGNNTILELRAYVLTYEVQLYTALVLKLRESIIDLDTLDDTIVSYFVHKTRTRPAWQWRHRSIQLPHTEPHTEVNKRKKIFS